MTAPIRRRRGRSRVASMSDAEAHAVAGHLLKLFTELELTTAQSSFLDALLDELVHRRQAAGAQAGCHCRLCVPAEPMGGFRKPRD